jgi:predicted adenine nucleotide alpha hydrolase (AANH) superfamily ATPase
MKLLLHACCAPCSIQCVEALLAESIPPHLFWYNPNIHPYTEYRSRGTSLYAFAGEKNLPLTIEDEYGLRSFIKGVSAIEESKESPGKKKRCAFCYRLRLKKTARFAFDRGFDAFSTTLLISPYQNHELIREIGEDLAVLYSIEFLYRDFRPRFREGRNQARSAGYYMQKYCGCIYSEEERYCASMGSEQ